jgi:hypothetical protein
MHMEGFVDRWFQQMRLKTGGFSFFTGRLGQAVVSLEEERGVRQIKEWRSRVSSKNDLHTHNKRIHFCL